jgi:hypothetical protein
MKLKLPATMHGLVSRAAKRNGHSMQRELLMRICQSFCYETDTEQARAMARTVAAEFAKHEPELTSGLTPAAELALELLHMAMANHVEKHKTAPGKCAVPYETWRQYCYAGAVTRSENSAVKRHAFRRAAQRLQGNGLIGRDGPWVWPVN